jgi:hypothetical protein
MKRAIGVFVVAAFSVALLISAEQAQQAGTGPGGGRKHHEQKTDTAASTTLKVDEKRRAQEPTEQTLRPLVWDPLGSARVGV